MKKFFTYGGVGDHDDCAKDDDDAAMGKFRAYKSFIISSLILQFFLFCEVEKTFFSSSSSSSPVVGWILKMCATLEKTKVPPTLCNNHASLSHTHTHTQMHATYKRQEVLQIILQQLRFSLPSSSTTLQPRLYLSLFSSDVCDLKRQVLQQFCNHTSLLLFFLSLSLSFSQTCASLNRQSSYSFLCRHTSLSLSFSLSNLLSQEQLPQQQNTENTQHPP
jgi:hypothetical protein